MPHDSNARSQASAFPIVLFSDRGRTVDSYTPAAEELAAAMPASANGVSRHVQGPHLRTIRTSCPRNKTGIVGISEGFDRARGHRYYWVNLGSSSRKFNITTLGRHEALRRAINLRREHLEKLALANAAIIGARLQALEQRRAS